MRVLIVEDEPRLARNIAEYLRQQCGFAVDISLDGEDGRHMALTNPYDLIVLDLMLPIVDGWTLLKCLRSEGRSTPVLVLTARDATEDIVRGLNEGSDDYLTKPFQMTELAARCQALIRRSHGLCESIIRIGPLEINSAAKKAFLEGMPVELHAMEFKLLEYLAMRSGHVISKEELLDHLYDFGNEIYSNVIEVYISSLRKKLDAKCGENLIRTVRGAGYVLEESTS